MHLTSIPSSVILPPMDPNFRPITSTDQINALKQGSISIFEFPTRVIDHPTKLHNRKKAKRDPRRKSKQKLAA